MSAAPEPKQDPLADLREQARLAAEERRASLQRLKTTTHRAVSSLPPTRRLAPPKDVDLAESGEGQTIAAKAKAAKEARQERSAVFKATTIRAIEDTKGYCVGASIKESDRNGTG